MSGLLTTNLPNIPVTINLSIAGVNGFGNVLLIVPLATNSLNGDRVVTFSSYAAADDYRTAGYISAATLLAAEAFFGQSTIGAALKVGYVDLVTPETYAAALTAIRALDDDWYGIAISSRVPADGVIVSNIIEGYAAANSSAYGRKFFVAQDDDTSWLDSGAPAAWAAIATNERTAVAWHSTDAQWMDIAWLSKVLSFDPSETSAPWHGVSLLEVAAYTPQITQGQRTFAIDNGANVGLPYGGQDFSIDPGQNLPERQISEIVTADWLHSELQDGISELLVDNANRGQKIPMTKVGQSMVHAVIGSVFSRATEIGHIPPKQYTITDEAITSADLTAKRLRFSVRAQVQGAARLFPITIDLSQNPVV